VKVFVSHSSRDDEFTVAFVQALRDSLGIQEGGDASEVQVDRVDLRPGDEWRSVIYHWLAECRAAVVLLSRAALESAWVRREVNILLWRHALGDPIEIITAYLDDIGSDDLRKAGIGDLTELQLIRHDGPAALMDASAASQLAGRIAAELGTLKEITSDGSPMSKWIKAVAGNLEAVRDKDRLVAAARVLKAEDDYLNHVRLPKSGCTFLAHQMLGRWHGEDLECAIGEIAKHTPIDWLRRLIGNVTATWVDAEASRGLLAFGPKRPGTLVLNAKSDTTASHYIDRASCRASSGFQMVAVTAAAGESFMQEFMKDCEKAVNLLLNLESPFTWRDYLGPDGTLPSAGKNRRHDVMILVVNRGTTELNLVAQGINEVRARFPWLVVLLLSGDALPTDQQLADWKLAGARRLEPALEPREEMDALQVVNKLKGLCDRETGPLLVGAA
jgi:hypothetical protein